MIKVSLVSWSTPLKRDPCFLPYLAYKVSTGKTRNKSIDEIKYNPDRAKEIIFEATEKYPSILEHISFTFLVEGISRVCSHQLVRHRIASYTQESQRYSIPVDRESINEIREFVAERLGILLSREIRESIYRAWYDKETAKALRTLLDERFLPFIEKYFAVPDSLKKDIVNYYWTIRILYESLGIYLDMIKMDVAYEDARFILPQAVKTRILVTVNLRELLHIACLRLSCKAQWEIRRVVKLMVDEAQKVIPFIWELVKKTCGGEDLCLEA